MNKRWQLLGTAFTSSLSATGAELTRFQNLGAVGDALINTPTLAVNRSRFNSASLGDWLYEYIKLMRGWGRLHLCHMWQASPRKWIRDLFQRLWGGGKALASISSYQGPGYSAGLLKGRHWIVPHGRCVSCEDTDAVLISPSSSMPKEVDFLFYVPALGEGEMHGEKGWFLVRITGEVETFRIF